ncbi:MAG: hypothetical protein QW607_10485 [Desulfurococcaceae archaeon]
MSIANLSIPQSFASVYFGEYLNCILNDPDWGTLRLYEEVAKRVNFPFEKIFNLSLRTYEGLLFEDPGIYNNCKPFINPVNSPCLFHLLLETLKNKDPSPVSKVISKY